MSSIALVHGSCADQQVDAVVNAANNRGNLLLIPGVLAVLQCRSHGVPDKVAKIIRIKVLVNGLFSCQNTSERADLFVVRN